jgi:hypothetical protein
MTMSEAMDQPATVIEVYELLGGRRTALEGARSEGN